jgi:hypothetical protein
MSDIIAIGGGGAKRQKRQKSKNFPPVKIPGPRPRNFYRRKILLPLFVMDRGEFDDLEETRATGRLYFNFIAFFFVEQALADRR